jgi:MFS family permease
MGMLSDRVGRKPLIYISGLVIILVYIEFMFVSTQAAVLMGGALYGIGNGAYLSVDYALACDALPSKENAAKFLGIWGVAAFIGTMVRPSLRTGPPPGPAREEREGKGCAPIRQFIG